MGIAAMLAACRADEVTELVIGVTTDLEVPSPINALRFVARYDAMPQPAVETTWDLDPGQPGAVQLPARIAVQPGHDPSAVVEYEVAALRQGAVVVARRARLAFARGRTVFLPLNLLRQCQRVTCDAEQTCGEPGCEPVAREASGLADYTRDREVAASKLDAAPLPADGTTLERIS